MRIIGKGFLLAFCEKYPDCRDWVESWLADATSAAWATPQAIKVRYASASFLSDNIVIFNVRGNNHRLEVQVAYQTGIVAVKWIGPHKEYSRRRR